MSPMGRRVRFLTWFRVIPMIVVALFGVISWGYAFAPASLVRLVYPLRYEEYILSSATNHGVDPYLVAAVIETESGWDPSARSQRGAVGLMQLLPDTADDMVHKGIVDGAVVDSSNLTDPATNIELGCSYLSYLISYFNGSTDHAIAAYNAGMGNVNDWSETGEELEDSIAFPETQAYLSRVTTALARYRELYPDAFA